MLSLSDISRTFVRGAVRVSALERISLTVAPGEFVAITGPSGSGKSTLLNIIGLTDRPTRGELSLGEGPVDFGSEHSLVALRRSVIGYVFQSFNLIAALTARENVAVSLLLLGRSYDAALQEADTALDRLGMSHRRDHLPFELSGGEMQRVAIARAVVHSPRIVVADEPTGNLDSGNGGEVLRILADLAHRGAAVIMATHSDVAISACTRVVRLRDGRMVA